MMINVDWKAKLNCIPHFHVLLIQNETAQNTRRLLSFPLITLCRINTYYVRRMDKILAFTAKPNFARKQLTSRQKSDIQFLYIITRRYLQNLQVYGLSDISFFSIYQAKTEPEFVMLCCCSLHHFTVLILERFAYTDSRY